MKLDKFSKNLIVAYRVYFLFFDMNHDEFIIQLILIIRIQYIIYYIGIYIYMVVIYTITAVVVFKNIN